MSCLVILTGVVGKQKFEGVTNIIMEIKREIDAQKKEMERKRNDEAFRRQMRIQAKGNNRYKRPDDEKQLWKNYLGGQDEDEFDLQTNQFGFNLEEFNRTGQVIQGSGKNGDDEV